MPVLHYGLECSSLGLAKADVSRLRGYVMKWTF